MTEEITAKDMIKNFWVVTSIVLFVLGLAMGYLGSKQECVNKSWEEFICNEGFEPKCIPYNNNNNTFFLEENNLTTVNFT